MYLSRLGNAIIAIQKILKIALLGENFSLNYRQLSQALISKYIEDI